MREVLCSIDGIGSSARRLLAASIIAAGAGSAVAGEVLHVADQNKSVQSSFTLDFGLMGGEVKSIITDTKFVLSIDADNKTAEFLTYNQTCEPLILPGGISTGDLTITIVPGSSSGTFTPRSGTFSTDEFYSISFTGDLTPYGLTSPVVLPGDSDGTVTYGTSTTGNIELIWDGAGQLQNPQNPQMPINFTYVCTVHADFFATPQCATDLNNDGKTDQQDLGVILYSYGSSTGQPNFVAAADLNNDGMIGQQDLAGILAVYGTPCQ
jgi:hypothetical protein